MSSIINYIQNNPITSAVISVGVAAGVYYAKSNPYTALIGTGITAVGALGYYIYRSRCQQLVGPHWDTDVNAEKFHQAITAAKANNAYGAFVHAYSQEEYQGMKLYLLNDGAKKGVAGVAVKPDGDIVSVFKHPDCTIKGVVPKYLMQKALDNGGTKLDCFDGFLPNLYGKLGFVETGRAKFDPEYAPEDWNYERDGTPDIVFMQHGG